VPKWAFDIRTLQWVVGLYCAFVGALILVAPHQVSPGPFSIPRLELQGYGIALLVSGVALILIPVAGPPRIVAYGIHLVAGIALLLLGARFLISGATGAAGLYGTLALGTMLAPRLAARGSAAHAPGLFAWGLSLAPAGSGT